MKPVLFTILLVFTLVTQSLVQNGTIFPKGEKAVTDHQVGTIWLNELSPADSTFKYTIAMATFAPGARLDGHAHPAGQVLLYTDGVGYYQERGKPLRIVHKGQVVKCQPGVEHWHGATPSRGVTYMDWGSPSLVVSTRRGLRTGWADRVGSGASTLPTRHPLTTALLIQERFPGSLLQMVTLWRDRLSTDVNIGQNGGFG